MRSNPYRLIFILLLVSVLSILLLQAFWLNSFYQQKVSEFSSKVYPAMEQVADKLQQQQNLQMFGETIIVEDTDTVLSDKKSVSIYDKKQFLKNIRTNAIPPRPDKKRKNSEIIITGDSIVTYNVFTDGDFEKRMKMVNEQVKAADIHLKKVRQELPKVKRQLVIATNNINSSVERIKDVDKLINRMENEFRLTTLEKVNPDTLKNIIKQSLALKGIFNPFEFSLRNNNDSGKVIFQSEGFNPTQTSYRSDLSAKKVFSTHDYLWLQFPGTNNYVLNSMKKSLILSLVFSLLLIGIFYYTMRLILRQKKISEIKNDFVNNMTHELKTPIATISLAVDAMNNPMVKNDEETYKKYTSILKEENARLNNHVERVLQMSLLEKGQLYLDKKQTDLVKVIQSSIESYRLQIQEKNAVIHFNTKAPVLFIGDEDHLKSVFNNLLDNALKYSIDPCIITIDIADKDNTIVIRFRDNGIGVDHANKERIFEKFYRAQGGNLHDVKGFGLGLSYVRSIIEAHGGVIELETGIEKGCSFRIQLNG